MAHPRYNYVKFYDNSRIEIGKKHFKINYFDSWLY